MATDEQLKQAIESAQAAASTAVTAQVSAERAAEEVATGLKKIREYEARRPIVKELTREIGVGGVDQDRVAAIETAIADLRNHGLKQQAPSVVDATRLDRMEAAIADVQKRLGEQRSEIVPASVGDLMDRVAELERLVIEMVTTPKQLAEHLHMTAEIMTAMDERFHTMRAADLATIDLHRQASEAASLAQGGLTAMVDNLRVDVDGLAGAVADLRNQLATRDQYRAQIISSRRGAA